MNCAALQREMITALEWYVDHGVDIAVQDEVFDRTVMPAVPSAQQTVQSLVQSMASAPQVAAPAFLGKSDAYEEAVKLAKAANTLEELQKTIQEFDGIALKKTASNMVFADGNPKADIMLIGEAPGADEDRIGKPFMGQSGQLLDRILKSIDLDRNAEDASKAVYLSNVVSWRPPGNRTPAPAEIEVSLPFIERHIQLIEPKMIVLCGGIAAQSLLGNSQSISKLRKAWHDYLPQTQALKTAEGKGIPAIATYHPSYLLRTPQQKKAVWADMLMILKKKLS